jgi:RDD family protein
VRSRIGGYVVDMVIFSAIAMIVTVISGFTLLAMTDWAKNDASDPQFWTFLSIIGLGVPLVWSALNVGLLTLRGQTGGQYVAGVRLEREDGSRLSARTAAGWWFCFNPVLFSWGMAIVVGFPLIFAISLVLSRGTIVVFGVIITVCFAAPLIALVSAILDDQNRALHDRITGVVAVPAA